MAVLERGSKAAEAACLAWERLAWRFPEYGSARDARRGQPWAARRDALRAVQRWEDAAWAHRESVHRAWVRRKRAVAELRAAP